MALSNSDLWAFAEHIRRRFGDQAQGHVFERIVEHAKKADEVGIANWQEIGRRIEDLNGALSNRNRLH